MRAWLTRVCSCGRAAPGLAGLGLAGGTVGQLGGHQLALHEARQPVRLAARDLRGDAGLVAHRPGRGGIALGDRELGADVVVPQLEQHLPRLDVIALLHRQARDLAARRRRELAHAGRP